MSLIKKKKNLIDNTLTHSHIFSCSEIFCSPLEVCHTPKRQTLQGSLPKITYYRLNLMHTLTHISTSTQCFNVLSACPAQWQQANSGTFQPGLHSREAPNTSGPGFGRTHRYINTYTNAETHTHALTHISLNCCSTQM